MEGEGSGHSRQGPGGVLRRGGEGVAYHDFDAKNHGSGNLNKGTEEKHNFRKDEGVDISFTKPKIDKFLDGKDTPVDLYYVGWVEKDEWLNCTVDVQKAGTYQISMLAANGSKYKDAELSLSINGKQKCTIYLEETKNVHRWKQQDNLAEITLDKGPQLLTLKFEQIKKGTVNIHDIQFELMK